jgi:hypothetical protein
MRYIKTFEELDFNQTIPVTTREVLTTYFCCDECGQLWREFNNSGGDICEGCESKNIEELSEDEWYDIVKTSGNVPDEWDKERELSSSMLMDLNHIGKKDKNYVN